MDALVTSMRDRLHAALRGLLPPGTRVALVDWPGYANVGDHLIFLGTLQLLRRLGVELAYTADLGGYSERGLRAAVGGDGVILLAGGGNFGDRYPGFQRVRERILLDFPRARIIGLPQTLDFTDPRPRDRTAAIVAGHDDVHLLWRDGESLERAERTFAAQNALAPDCAFALEELPAASRPASAPQVWLSRSDDERSGERLLPPPGEPALVTDWLLEPEAFQRSGRGRMRAHAVRAARAASRNALTGGRLSRQSVRVRTEISRRRLEAGVALLSLGEVLVTDRLHAHVLSVLLGKPHVVVDTGYGKLDRFIRTWTHDASYLARATSAAEAAAAARALSRR
jgi:exopolysaccharide biosynthesis predicted pyruvyltransferase EpsI